jgi:hypothetical protein
MTEATSESRRVSLRARRQHADESRHLDLVIPETSPPIYLRLLRADPDYVEDQVLRGEESKAPGARSRANAAVVARYCAGVYEMGEGGKLRSIDPDDPDGQPPRFDDRLGELLEMPPGIQPTQLALELCGKAGVRHLAAKLCEWSGMDPAERVEELRGE